MESGKRVEDIMVSIFDYPHIPYWFSFNEAIRTIAKASFRNDSKKSLEPTAMLVFDEKYNLLGTLSLQDIIKGLEPNFRNVPACIPREKISQAGILFLRPA